MLDMPTKTEKEKAAVSVEAWRVEFREAADNVPADAIKITGPRRLTAELRALDAANVFAPTAPQSSDSFTIVWIPPSAKASVGIERDAEAWLRDGQAAGNGAVVRAGVRTVRIFWAFNRALIYAGAENVSSALDAVVRFTVAQRETIALESEMRSTWAAIEVDAPLTHSITRRQLRRQSHVNVMTVTATRMKAKFLRITQALEQLDPLLEDTSKRIYAELVLAGALHDRLELLEDPVQFALENYEIANSRLTEAKFAYKEQSRARVSFTLEAAIAVLEAAIVAVLVYPFHLFW